MARSGLQEPNPNPQHTANDGSPEVGQSVAVTDQGADGQDDADVLVQCQTWFKASREHLSEWRVEASECYDCVAGRQWTDVDVEFMKEQGRPAIVFNRTAPFVDAVCGLEITNRQETRYVPRTLAPPVPGVAELATNAGKWVRGECDAEDEESAAFRDTVVCGLGWTETVMDYGDDPDGMIKVSRVDPMEMFYDPSSIKDNLSDGRYLFRVKDVPLRVAQALAPGFEDVDLNAMWASEGLVDGHRVYDAQEAPFYRNDQGRGDPDTDVVRLVEAEWWETVTSHRIHIPGARPITATPQQHATLKQRASDQGIPFHSVKDKRRQYHKALLGNVVLTRSDGPDEGGFSYKAMTGKRDRNKRIWYGLVRAMRDPQMWANKWLSQILHILNANAKGGLMAETTAFENVAEAEDTWADPQSITWLAPGGLDRIREKPAVTFPQGLDQLLQFAIGAMPQVTGVNPEMMGQVDRDQAGVLEMHRTQRGMSVLAQFFDAKRRYQKEQGRLLLWMIQNFISDGRLIRVGGAEDAQYVRLLRDPQTVRYDVIVDDTPFAPNQKERTFGVLMQMAPFLKGLPPTAMAEMLKYSPLPETLTTKIAQLMSQPPPAPPPEQAKPATQRDQAQIALDQVKGQLHQASIAKLGAETRRISAETGATIEEKDARVELLRAQAIALMSGIGMDQAGSRIDQANDAISSLLQAHGAALQAQGQAHGQQLAAQGQAHDQMMAQAQFGHLQHQAAAANAQAQQAHGLAQQQADTAQQAAQQPQTGDNE